MEKWRDRINSSSSALYALEIESSRRVHVHTMMTFIWGRTSIIPFSNSRFSLGKHRNDVCSTWIVILLGKRLLRASCRIPWMRNFYVFTWVPRSRCVLGWDDFCINISAPSSSIYILEKFELQPFSAKTSIPFSSNLVKGELDFSVEGRVEIEWKTLLLFVCSEL